MTEKKKKRFVVKSKNVKRHAPLKAKKKAQKSAAKQVAKVKKAEFHTAGTAKGKPQELKNGALSVYDLQGKELESLTLDPIFTEMPVNTDVVYQAVLMYQAGQREGTAATKDRGHVRGGGKKPWKQKGTGQARHGSRRSPIWRGGGVTFGPMPREYSYSIPAQMRRRAVVEGIKDKVLNGKLYFVKNLEIQEPKTKLVAGIMETFKLEKPLFMVDVKSKNFGLGSRNIQGVSVKTAVEVNVLDVAGHKECVITKGAYAGLLKRLKS
jgi:large subunit ribosomal protein L4